MASFFGFHGRDSAPLAPSSGTSLAVGLSKGGTTLVPGDLEKLGVLPEGYIVLRIQKISMGLLVMYLYTYAKYIES